MNNTQDEGIETSLDMDWVAELEMKVSDTNFEYRNREPRIYKVPYILKMVDHEAYEPLLVSLGPYHRDKPHLQAMNQVKWKYLKYVLEQNPGMVMKDYVDLIKGLETRARDAYSEEVEMSSNRFVEMMLLDGCFLMLTIIGRNYGMESTWWTANVVVRDIFVLENQLPFFLLESLYQSAFPDGRPCFRNLAFEFIRMSTSSNMELPSDNETFHHIIHLCLSCIDPKTNHGNGNDNGGNGNQSAFGFLCVSLPLKLHSCLLSQVNKIRTGRDANPEEDLLVPGLPWIPSATVLNDAGIQLKRKQKAKSFLDITFHNGKLEIPQIRIHDCTNSLLKNLMADEQYSRYSKFHVTSYMVLMNFLINTAADAELLQQHEIIISDLGDGQEIATLFNKLNTDVCYNIDHFYLAEVITAMRKHLDTRCNKWLARLNRKYFSNPWARCSLIGAVALFLLTVIQTTYAVVSYDRPSN